MIKFDFDRLDDLKYAIECGIDITGEISEVEKISIYKSDDEYVCVYESYSTGLDFDLVDVREEDWEVFKTKVAEIFLGK